MSTPTVSLVVKYRPRSLAELLGQDHLVAGLKAFVAGPYPTAFLFAGESGTGKTSAAYALARELGCSVEDTELGGLFEIPSGSQSADAVRHLLEMLRYRPLCGSGWRVCIVNECDRMALPCETIWLDALEHLPPDTVVVFTTNDTARLSRRFRDRCQAYRFEASTDKLAPCVRQLAERIWAAEVGAGECPGLDVLGLPTMGDMDSMHCSFRLALQQLQQAITVSATIRPPAVAPRAPENAPAPSRPSPTAAPPVVANAAATETPAASGPDLAEMGRRWLAGESIQKLAKQAGLAWPALQAKLKALGYKRARLQHA